MYSIQTKNEISRNESSSPYLTDEIRQLIEDHPIIQDLWEKVSSGFKDDLKIYAKTFYQIDVETCPEICFTTFVQALCNYSYNEDVRIDDMTLKLLRKSNMRCLADIIQNQYLEPVYKSNHLVQEI